MGAGTAQGGACLLISGKERKNMEFVVFAGVFVHHARERPLKAVLMGAAVRGVDVGADTDEKSGKTFQEVSS